MYTKEDLKKAYQDGGWVTTWSDMGFDTKWSSFDEWFNKEFINSKFKKEVTWIIPNYNQYDELFELLEMYKTSLYEDSENKLTGEIDIELKGNDNMFMFYAVSNRHKISLFEIGVFNFSLKFMSFSTLEEAAMTITDFTVLKEKIDTYISSEKMGQKLNNFIAITNKTI